MSDNVRNNKYIQVADGLAIAIGVGSQDFGVFKQTSKRWTFEFSDFDANVNYVYFTVASNTSHIVALDYLNMPVGTLICPTLDNDYNFATWRCRNAGGTGIRDVEILKEVVKCNLETTESSPYSKLFKPKSLSANYKDIITDFRKGNDGLWFHGGLSTLIELAVFYTFDFDNEVGHDMHKILRSQKNIMVDSDTFERRYSMSRVYIHFANYKHYIPFLNYWNKELKHEQYYL